MALSAYDDGDGIIAPNPDRGTAGVAISGQGVSSIPLLPGLWEIRTELVAGALLRGHRHSSAPLKPPAPGPHFRTSARTAFELSAGGLATGVPDVDEAGTLVEG